MGVAHAVCIFFFIHVHIYISFNMHDRSETYAFPEQHRELWKE